MEQLLAIYHEQYLGLVHFLRRGNSITCRVTGHRRYSAALPQGGLEVPSTLHFEGEVKDIAKLKKFVEPKLAEHK